MTADLALFAAFRRKAKRRSPCRNHRACRDGGGGSCTDSSARTHLGFTNHSSQPELDRVRA
jgi:hypothetical protein